MSGKAILFAFYFLSRALTRPAGGLTIRTRAPIVLLLIIAHVIPRPLLVALVFALPILVVTFAVILGASSLAQSLGDAAAAQALLWVAIGALIVLVIDVLLLVGVLGIQALGPDSQGDEPRE